ncbi:MerR family transcriptional regulator [Desulforhopalus singaporensis]|uniref:Transcriptional regulator, MerR family n=1 Tax=Desulforhopalus singaporensis TaxID=91360 RepID=A0A1H0NUY0_9BACT|nr:MerR family transcriptional regulator [Desulforhopalus singaporensis]SDO96265.1 transcriptional regulator, MerR family [Desulforhopalus singaporensis]
MIPAIPDKLYFKIGEVAKMADVPPHVLRYWESEFPAIKPRRANSKQRLYKKQDVEIILQIKYLLHDRGFTIAGAKKLLKSGSTINLDEIEDKKHQGSVPDKLKSIKDELIKLQRILNSKKETN